MQRLSIIVVEKDRDRAMLIVDGLRDAGAFRRDGDCRGDRTCPPDFAQRNPDLVLIDAGNPSRDVLEELALATAPDRAARWRCLSIKSDGSLTKRRDRGGDVGLCGRRVAGQTGFKPILDAAIARFHMLQKMRIELSETRRALEERKVIDRAKGILMRARGH